MTDRLEQIKSRRARVKAAETPGMIVVTSEDPDDLDWLIAEVERLREQVAT